MGFIDDLVNKAKGNNSTLEVLNDILLQLKLLNQKSEEKYYKKWSPFSFQFYFKGGYVYDEEFGSSKWGFIPLDDSYYQLKEPMRLEYDYEFHSLQSFTQNRTYNPAFRLIINGESYPEEAHIFYKGTDRDSDQLLVYRGHNYSYDREYKFARVWLYQSNHGIGEYPFKMVVDAPWTLSFMVFQTTTSYYWHFLQINGWRLYPLESRNLEELTTEIKEMI